MNYEEGVTTAAARLAGGADGRADGMAGLSPLSSDLPLQVVATEERRAYALAYLSAYEAALAERRDANAYPVLYVLISDRGQPTGVLADVAAARRAAAAASGGRVRVVRYVAEENVGDDDDGE